MAGLVSCGVAFLLGVTSHVCWFHSGEHHLYGPRYVALLILSLAGGTTALERVYGFALSVAFTATLAIVSSLLAGIFTSLTIWRALFNPLNRFPGPFSARLSALSWAAGLTHFDLRFKLQALHAKHGRHVRIGPNALSIADPDGMEVSYGPHTIATKSDWYDFEAPFSSMQTTRSSALHAKRRRVWAPAFSTNALREYEKHIDHFNDKFVQRLADVKGERVNASKWFNLYSFDVMGRLAFGKDYRMLESGERHWALDLLSDAMKPLGLSLPMWLFRIVAAIPGLAAGYHKFARFCREELAWKVRENGKKDSSEGDVMSWLLKAYKDVEHPEDDMMLLQDAKLIVVAGSDTTAATFTYLFYHLAKEPAHAQRIREELRPLTQGTWSDKDINHLPVLNGAINEALRLHPPVPSGVERETPPDGMRIGDTFLPGSVKFRIPQYVLSRDAFAPFHMGAFGCIGKQLALMELRTLTARILREFEVGFAEGEDGTKLMTETLDHFTLTMGELVLVFTPLGGR